jgi:hypothetical protein
MAVFDRGCDMLAQFLSFVLGELLIPFIGIGAPLAQKTVHARTVFCAFLFHAPLPLDGILK